MAQSPQRQVHRRKNPIPASVRSTKVVVPKGFHCEIPKGYTAPGKSSRKKKDLRKDEKPNLDIVDTNVLINDTYALFAFEDNDVILPFTVIRELDELKRRPETRAQAQAVSRLIYGYRIGNKPVQLKSGGTIRVEMTRKIVQSEETEDLDLSIPDDRILMTAYWHHVENIKTKKYKHVAVVSDDINVLLKAWALGMYESDFYRTNVAHIEDADHLKKMVLSTDLIQTLGGHSFKNMELLDHKKIQQFVSQNKIVENEGVLVCMDDPDQTPMFACVWKNGRMKKVGKSNKRVYENGSVKPYIPTYYKDTYTFNPEQEIFIENLFDQNVTAIFCYGQAGTGKTLIAVKAALQMVLKDKMYNQIIITRPIISSASNDLGFMPGTKEEKMAPWIKPIRKVIDSWFEQEKRSPEGRVQKLTQQFPDKKKKRGGEDDSVSQDTNKPPMSFEDLLSNGTLEIEADQHVRGNTYSNTIVIIDEAQNMSGPVGKTWLTRMGEDSKFIMIGDVEQVDSTYLRSDTNALAIIGEAIQGQDWASTVHLKIAARSKESAWAAKNLR